MHPADIKAALARAGYRQKQVAALCAVTPTSVNDVISGRSRSRAVESQIAALVGLPLSQLWPQWFAPEAAPPIVDTAVMATAEEIDLLRAFRTLDAEKRLQVRRMIDVLGTPAPTHITVAGSRNRVAGRDLTESAPTRRKR
jgi:lambda repressor-like predicted transcriptional regulator